MVIVKLMNISKLKKISYINNSSCILEIGMHLYLHIHFLTYGMFKNDYI